MWLIKALLLCVLTSCRCLVHASRSCSWLQRTGLQQSLRIALNGTGCSDDVKKFCSLKDHSKGQTIAETQQHDQFLQFEGSRLHPASKAIYDWITDNPGEKAVHDIFTVLFRNCHQTSYFLDIGANAGLYTLQALESGCSAIMFDPQPSCWTLIYENLCLNPRLIGNVALIPTALSNETSQFVVPGTRDPWRCYGTFTVHNQNTVNSSLSPLEADLLVNTNVLSTVIKHSPLYVVKIDTEGHEIFILRSLLRYFSDRIIENAIVEITPLFWKRDGFGRGDAFEVLSQIISFGYKIDRLHPAQPLATVQDLERYILHAEFVQEDIHIYL